MDKVVELIVSWIQKNLKNPKLYAILAVLIIIIALIFPYIDANFFFYNRIEKRVSILQNLSEIDMEKVSQFPALQEEYDAILSEIKKQREWSISGVIPSEQTTSKVSFIKFLSGGALAWLIALCVPFMDTFKDSKTKALSFLLVALFGGILGGIGYVIPTIFNPWVNYIGYPVLQLISLIAIAIKPKQG
ncbi:MAG: hypothetical protein ACI4E0_07070 [Blautia sp.]